MKALISGAFGQDAQWLVQLLNDKGYEVFVTDRRRSRQGTYKHDAAIVRMDLLDGESVRQAIMQVKPDEIYHLAAMSHVGWSFSIPESTTNTNALGTLHILEVIRHSLPETRMYFAATSEMFGGIPRTRDRTWCKKHDCEVSHVESFDDKDMMVCPGDVADLDVEEGCKIEDWEDSKVLVPQGENTPFHPQSPYACAKLYAYWMVRLYRETYNLKVCSGILFNHESKYRGEEFLPMKVCNWIKRFIKEKNVQESQPNYPSTAVHRFEAAVEVIGGTLKVGNIFAKRDWGWAKEYIEGMFRILHQDEYRLGKYEAPQTVDPKKFVGSWKHMPGSMFKDYVLGTGSTITVAEFIERAFAVAGFEGQWMYEEEDRLHDDEPFVQLDIAHDTNWKFVICEGTDHPGHGSVVVEIDPQFYRPAEVDVLFANPTMANRELGWKASKNSVDLIIRDMLERQI